jgi:plasmid stabilization system protein ParE
LFRLSRLWPTLEGIRRYIGNFNPYAARDMAERIIEAGNSLATFPYRGPSRSRHAATRDHACRSLHRPLPGLRRTAF